LRNHVFFSHFKNLLFVEHILTQIKASGSYIKQCFTSVICKVATLVYLVAEKFKA